MKSVKPQLCHANFIEQIKTKQDKVYPWLESLEKDIVVPLYSSVDIRDADFKVSVVDTNLFPAGFNNLCEHGLADAVGFMRQAILRRVPKCERVVIVAEEHTRNAWYLENVRILQQIIEQAGFQARIATFLNVQPAFCETARSVDLETATGQTVKIHCFKRILSSLESDRDDVDLIILNNDLTTGIPEILKTSKIPIYPSLQAGWHARHKSQHFAYAQELLNEFGKIVGLDPWLFSSLFSVVDHVDINNDADRARLKNAAVTLFQNIEKKYREHGISEKPFIFVKSDYGTYGMGVMPVEDPDDIVKLSRRDKNKLYKGKSSKVISRYILQEGVPTAYSVDEHVSEVCIYQIENNLIGGFYRFNTEKNERENLNSSGMGFKKMCPHLPKYGQCGVHHDMSLFDTYRILARIAAIAARFEINALESHKA